MNGAPRGHTAGLEPLAVSLDALARRILASPPLRLMLGRRNGLCVARAQFADGPEVVEAYLPGDFMPYEQERLLAQLKDPLSCLALAAKACR